MLSKELEINKDFILKIIKLLYKVLEAGNYWFKTYYFYYIK